MSWGVFMNLGVCLGLPEPTRLQPVFFFANVHWTIPEVISAPTFLVQTCYHQILLCLDKPILQYTCQTFFEEQTSYNNLHTKLSTSKGGDFVSLAILRRGFMYYIYIHTPFKKYNLCQVSSTSSLQSVLSQLQIASVLLGGAVVSILFRRSSYHVILPLLGEFADLCWPRGSKVTVLDILTQKWQRKELQHSYKLMWCHDDVGENSGLQKTSFRHMDGS